MPNPPKWPRQYSFTVAGDWAEDAQRRNMYPTMWDLLELSRLENWYPERTLTLSLSLTLNRSLSLTLSLPLTLTPSLTVSLPLPLTLTRSPERIPSISHNSVVLLGSQGTGPRQQQVTVPQFKPWVRVLGLELRRGHTNPKTPILTLILISQS